MRTCLWHKEKKKRNGWTRWLNEKSRAIQIRKTWWYLVNAQRKDICRYLQARYSVNKWNNRVELQQSMIKLTVKQCLDFDSIYISQFHFKIFQASFHLALTPHPFPTPEPPSWSSSTHSTAPPLPRAAAAAGPGKRWSGSGGVEKLEKRQKMFCAFLNWFSMILVEFEDVCSFEFFDLYRLIWFTGFLGLILQIDTWI